MSMVPKSSMAATLTPANSLGGWAEKESINFFMVAAPLAPSKVRFSDCSWK